MRKRILLIVAALLALGTVSASCASTPEANTVISFINGIRSQQGLPALAYNPDLQFGAIYTANYYSDRCSLVLGPDAPVIRTDLPLSTLARLGGSGGDLNSAIVDLYARDGGTLDSPFVTIYGAYSVITTCNGATTIFVSVIVGG